MLTSSLSKLLPSSLLWSRTIVSRSFSVAPTPNYQRQILNLPRNSMIPVPKPMSTTTTVPTSWRSSPVQQQSTAPASPFSYGEPWINNVLEALNRNNRKAKKANHGKRPCSRVGRRARARKFGNPNRGRG